MNITFMIGNGFDINCGMKCSYRDAYDGYVNTDSKETVIRDFKKRIRSDATTWADFEVAMASDMKNYQNERDFIICVRDFKKYLNQHLWQEEKKILDLLNNNIIHNLALAEMKDSLESFYDGVSHDITREISQKIYNEGKNYSAISFNYTSVFDNLMSFATSLQRNDIIHIHGKLNDDLVLGMDNLEQLSGAPYIISKKGKRAFIKTEFNRAFDQSRVDLAKNTIASSDIICVYGMSLGESDLTWRNLLLQWLHNSGVHLFFYNHKCSCLKDMTADERLDNEEDAKINILLKFGVTSNEIEGYLPKIHIPCCKNIFNIGTAVRRGIDLNTNANEKKRQISLAARLGS